MFSLYILLVCHIYTSLAGSEHEARIFDQNLCGSGTFSETQKVLSDFLPDVVGISIRNVRIYSAREGLTNPDDAIKHTIEIIKTVSEKIIIVAGGPAFSMFPVRFMQSEPRIDFGVFLEGEESFPLLLRNIDHPERVKGILYRNNGEVIHTGKSMHVDFGGSVKPDRKLNSPKQYSGEYAIGVQSKRGCILRCNYCNYIHLSGDKNRLRPAKSVVDEIEDLMVNYGLQSFAFTDNVFNVPSNHAEEICNEIIRRRLEIHWSDWFNEKFITERFVDLAIKAGCRKFEFSPDGYSDQSLKWLNKNFRKEEILKVYNVLKKKDGINVEYNFMLGIPGQNVFQLAMLALFCLKLKLSFGKRVRINFGKLGIEPDTDVQQTAVREKIISHDTDVYLPTFYCVGIFGQIYKFKKMLLGSQRKINVGTG